MLELLVSKLANTLLMTSILPIDSQLAFGLIPLKTIIPGATTQFALPKGGRVAHAGYLTAMTPLGSKLFERANLTVIEVLSGLVDN